MAMGKNYRVLEKNKPETPHSIILEHRSRPETLLFESQAVANLCKFDGLLIFPPTFTENVFRRYFQLLKRRKPFANSTRKFWTRTDVWESCS